MFLTCIQPAFKSHTMKLMPMDPRKLLRYSSLRPPPQSSSFASHTQPVNHPKPISRSSENADPLVNQPNHPSAPLRTTIPQLRIEKRDLDEGRGLHADIKESNKILDLCCKRGRISDAQKLFDEMRDRDLCSWNILISGYAKMGMVSEARRMFDEMPQRDNFSWTAMISAYVKHKQPAIALELYRLMQRNGSFTCSNKYTVSSVLSASAAMQSLRLGKEIHGHIMRTGLDSDVVVWSALLDVYGKCRSLNEARYIFDQTSGNDTVSWTSMIDRYFGDGKWEEGLSLFSKLLTSGVKPNEFTFSGVLNACAHQTTEELGRQIHGHMMRIGFDPYSFAASALIHMYTKCGSVERAHRVFNWLPRPDLVSFTSLINGYAQNGQPHEALKLFDALLRSGDQPDHITFVGVLSACTHAGLVDKGLDYFYSIEDKHGLTHTSDHYACVIDLLSRSGKFNKVKDIMSKMPMKPDKFIWASLLGGCRIHGNYEFAHKAAEALFEIEPDNAATYVTLASIYATAGKWSQVAEVRRLMDERGVVKKPGMSWIHIKEKVHIFLVGDKSHIRSKEIFEFLGKISKRMKEEGYVAHTDYVLHDVEEEQKEESLFFHSEKLAVAFGIMSTCPGTVVKVFKNLRTCVDCHSAIKFISRISERKIVVRDSSRFHCFELGKCSCHDYW